MGHAGHGSAGKAPRHAPSENGNPLIDMQSSATAPKLDDPGIGLRDNGRRVLTYGAMRSLFEDPDGREPSREVELHLTGHMEKFSWSFDGIPFASAEPLRLNYGERMRIVLVNDTMMQHPIHLHRRVERLKTPTANSSCASTPSTCRPAPAAATACAPTRWAAGPTTATCCTTWKPE